MEESLSESVTVESAQRWFSGSLTPFVVYYSNNSPSVPVLSFLSVYALWLLLTVASPHLLVDHI